MLRPLAQQVVVITGASSGIGRAMAVRFGAAGASVVLAARNEVALQEAAREVEHAGGIALVTPTDVAEWEQVERLATRAVDRFGRVDTWVNNASVSEYATVEQMTIAEIERIIQVNLLGMIYGVKAALPHLKRQRHGTIVNVSSVVGERAVPLQSVYVATKHGIKGFTESLRLELEHEKTGITVTLIEPGSINTPFFNHARSKMGVKPSPMPPVYPPSAVAEAIAFAAERPRRTIVVGGGGKMLGVLEQLSPALTGRVMLLGGQGFKQQQADAPDDGLDALFAPVPGTGRVEGDFGHLTRSSSLYTRYLELHPARKRVALGAALLGGLALVRRLGR